MSSLSLYTTTISNSIVPFSLIKTKWYLQQSMKSRSNNNSCMHFHESYSTPFSPLRFQKVGRVPEAAAGAVTATAEELPEGLRPELMPKHVAVIMDGNVRWAKQRGLHGSAGHQAGVQSLRKLMDLCVRWGVKVLSVFAFSYDNWACPKLEVEFLIRLFERELKSELNNFTRDGIRISVIGDSSKLPNSLKKIISETENDTKNNTKLQLIVALNYSGKYDIVQACKNIAQKVKDGVVQVDGINEGAIEQELKTNCTEFPNPDLLIRTSGELRVSNFLLWQLAYTELLFVEALWPDFGQEELAQALKSFQERDRRYGKRDV